MVKKIEHIDEILKLLNAELKQYKFPAVSHPKWAEIVNTPFTTLISCILSLRTKDEVTDKASIRLLSKYNTPEKLVKSFKDEFKTKIKESRIEKHIAGSKKTEFIHIWLKVDKSIFKNVIKHITKLEKYPHLAVVS